MIFQLNRRDAETQRFLKRSTRFKLFSFALLCSLRLCVSAVHSQEVQQTPTVLLPAKYLEDVRAPLKLGGAAPDFTLSRCEYDQKSAALQLSKWRDAKKHNGVVIVFWAFWCDTWKDITRDLNEIKPQLDAMKLQVLGVAVDASQQPVARRAFEAKKIWWPVVIDEKSSVSAGWGVRRVPTIFVLDKNGAVRAVHEGFPGLQTFVKQTAQTLNLKVPAAPRKSK
jgi:peroxiredoxin